MTTTLQTGVRGIGQITGPCYNAGGADLAAGSPVMRSFDSLVYAGGVRRPINGLAQGEFAGVLTSKLKTGGNGDIASNRLVVAGEVKATVYVDGTPSTYTVGAQLAPYYDSTNGAYFQRVAWQTGITLVEDWTAKDANTLYDQANGLGAWIRIEPQAVQGLQHYVWASPAVSDADYYKAALATSAGATTTLLAASMLNSATPDYPRVVGITPGGTTADVPAGDVTITGLDIYGNTITDTITFAANASTVGYTTKAFASLTSVVFPIQDGAAATYNIGTGPSLGLGRVFTGKPTVLQAKANGTVEGTAPTVTGDADEIAKNVISFNTTLNSTSREAFIYVA